MMRRLPMLLVVLAACAPWDGDDPNHLPDGGTISGPKGDAGNGAVELRVEPGAIDFGTVVTLDEVPRDVVLVNTASVGVDVTVELVDAGSHFALPNPPESLSPGEQRRVFVVYRPQYEGEHTAILRIRWADETLEVPLRGSGIVATACVPEQLHVAPTPIELGAIAPSLPLALTVSIMNEGETCRLPAPYWLENTEGTFKLVQPYPEGSVLHEEGTRTVQISVVVKHAGPIVGRLLVAGSPEDGAVVELRVQ